jgi:hypothetical protein
VSNTGSRAPFRVEKLQSAFHDRREEAEASLPAGSDAAVSNRAMGVP